MAAVGVNNLVVVETEDALLITTREQAQDVGKVVKYLDEKKLRKSGVAVVSRQSSVFSRSHTTPMRLADD